MKLFSCQGDRFSRVSSLHGQTLLSLAFNYGILSLMTLTLGTDRIDIDMIDRPEGCLLDMSEDDRRSRVIELLMRDFRTGPGANVSYMRSYQLYTVNI